MVGKFARCELPVNPCAGTTAESNEGDGKKMDGKKWKRVTRGCFLGHHARATTKQTKYTKYGQIRNLRSMSAVRL
jgi:hypothetical protein